MKRTKTFMGLTVLAVGLGIAFSLVRNGAQFGSAASEAKTDRTIASFTPELAMAKSALAALPTNQTATARGTLPFMVTCKVPFQVSQREAVEAMGAKVIGLYSRKTVIVEATPAVRARIAADKRFEKVVEVGPADKIQPALAKLVENGAKDIEVAIIATAAMDRESVLGMLAADGGSILSGCINEGDTIRAKLPAEAVAELASHGEVRWMEQYIRPQLNNDLAVLAPQMNVSGVWTAHGLTGKDQNISTSDSGIDTGDLTTLHLDLRNQIKDIKVVSGCNTSDKSGHGTHTSGSIVGNGAHSDGKIKGTAYEANLYAWFCGTSGSSISLPSSMESLYLNNGAWPATMHSASWGSAVNGQYNASCRNHDSFVWSHPEFLPVFSAGNEGDSGTKTIGSPGSAKNVLTVGATQNARSGHDGNWGNGNPKITATFSSRGPCQDGRIKPDIAAPGVGILSTRANGISYSYGNYDDYYAYDSGTSMACPLTAGSVVLTRQWLVEFMGYDGTVHPLPTAALIKAVVTGGAKDANTPNNDQGWGRVDLEQTLFPTNGAVKLVDRIPFAENFFTNIVVETTNAAPLDVQLVWIDYPGDATADQTVSRLVNDLDLSVESAAEGVETTLWGNGGKTPDTLNNVESIRIANAPATKYVITVDCTTIFRDHTQGGAAALYIRGAFDPGAESTLPTSVHLTKLNKDFRTLDRALQSVKDDDEIITITNDVRFTKSVTLTNSCSIVRTNGAVVTCYVGSELRASGEGVEVSVTDIPFDGLCSGIAASNGATMKLKGVDFEELRSVVADVGSTNILENVTNTYGDNVLTAAGEIQLLNSTLNSESCSSAWTVSGRLLINGSSIQEGRSITVNESGNITLDGAVGTVSAITLEKATKSSLTLAENIVSLGRVEVTAPGASTNNAVIGEYLCSAAKASEVARNLVNMLDAEGELAGYTDSGSTAIYWGYPEASESAAAVILDDGTTKHYYYTFRAAMRSWKSGDATLTVCVDQVYSNATTTVGSLTLTSKTGSETLTVSGDAQFAIPAGNDFVIKDIDILGGAKAISDCLFKVTGGSLTLDSGAVISGVSGKHSVDKSYSGIITVTSGSVTMNSGSTIYNCSSVSAGGAIWLGGANAVANLNGGTITGCSALTYGGAVYAWGNKSTGATVRVQGDFTAADNHLSSSALKTNNLYIARNATLALTDTLTGKVGLNFGSLNNLEDLNVEGASFIDISGAGSAAEASATCFFHDEKELIGAYDSAQPAIVWQDSSYLAGQCDEYNAGARAMVEGESKWRYYPTLGDAFDYVKTNATIEASGYHRMYYNTGSEYWYQEYLTSDVEISSDIVLTTWEERARKRSQYPAEILRSNLSMFVVNESGSLTISNIVVAGNYWYTVGGSRSFDSSNGLISVKGGSLTLQRDACVGYVRGIFSRASNAITVNHGTFTMESGAVVTNSYNFFDNPFEATGCGGGILLDNSTAYLNGGTVADCSAARAGGVCIANKSTAYVSGDFTVNGNFDLTGSRNNMVVGDLSSLVLTNAFTGSVGINEGISCRTDVFATVAWEYPSISTLNTSAKNFFHDIRGSVGQAITNGEGQAELAWGDIANSSTYIYTNSQSVVYQVALAVGQAFATPKAFSVTPIKNGTTLGFTVSDGVEGCWYTVYSTDSLSEPFTELKTVQLKAGETFLFEVDATKAAQYYKVVADGGIK